MELATTKQTTVTCRCCQRTVAIDLQERRVKSPIILVTCRTRGCKLENVTLAMEAVDDYYSRDLSVWGMDAAS